MSQKKSPERKIEINKVIIIGAGAAGMMAAYSASLNKKEVIIIEKNSMPGKKLLLTGKGRCNITNDCDDAEIIRNISSNGSFMYSSLHSFSSREIMDFFHNIGIKTKTERGRRVFPENDSAGELVDALYKTLVNMGVCFLFDLSVSDILAENGHVTGVKTAGGDILSAGSVILCTGGASYPGTGSNGDGYRMARSLGHSVTDIMPGLVPIELKEHWVKELTGLSLKNVKLSMHINGRKVFSETGEMIFTHFGISGPLVLSMSSRIPSCAAQDYDIRIFLDLKPALDHEVLDRRLLRDFDSNLNKMFKNSLGRLFPAKIIPVIIGLSGIDPYKEVNVITREERECFGNLIKNMELTYKRSRPLSEAIITKGGISLKEIDPKTLESKIVKGLFFAGEILDLDAATGGYNLTIAFSTGYKAGMMS